MGLRDRLAAWLSPHSLRIPQRRIDDVCRKHSVEGWHRYAARQRHTLGHVTWACDWIRRHQATTARIHEAGCGIGLNLLWLSRHGFGKLSGSDIVPANIAAANDLAMASHCSITYQVGDGRDPVGRTEGAVDTVLALNWIYLLDDFSLTAWLANMSSGLAPNGTVIFDAIDRSFAKHPDHEGNTADWSLPREQRRVSEYRQRYDASDVTKAAEANGMHIFAHSRLAGLPPRVVYILSRAGTPGR
jgi:hypothetical protein